MTDLGGIIGIGGGLFGLGVVRIGAGVFGMGAEVGVGVGTFRIGFVP